MSVRLKWRIVIASVCLLQLLAPAGRAQWTTQNIPLQPGWNAVQLNVAPASNDCDAVFSGLPVESVWRFTKRYSSVEFNNDPAVPLPEPTHWVMWLPPTHPQQFVRSMFKLEGGHAYLVKVADAASPFTWTVKGRPVMPRIDWIPNYLNLVGFPVNPVAPPTFQSYFQHEAEIEAEPANNLKLYEINMYGEERRIRYTGLKTIQPGVAYWVGCNRPTDYVAPVRIRPLAGGSIDFGQTLVEQDIYIENVSTMSTFTVKAVLLVSETPPAGRAELAGPVPLAYFDRDLASNIWGWVDWPTNGLTRSMAPGELWTLRLGVRRASMNAYTPTGTNGAAYQTLMEVTDAGASIRYLVPVVADNPPLVVRNQEATGGTGGGYSSDTNLPVHHLYEGLWVGNAVVDKVSRAALGTNITWDATVPTNVTTELSMRLILHVDTNGQARLLQKVIVAWVPPATTNDSGEYRLYSKESDVAGMNGTIHRLSSVAFPPGTSVQMTGSMSNAVHASVSLGYDDPSNPFRHAYHPDHDNRNASWQPVGAGVESLTVVRSIDMVVDTNSVSQAGNLFWGPDDCSGVYRETIQGLLQQPIYFAGKFTLKRINRANAIR
ncbi:MAG: hypothetical protein C0404_05205 [Verrucomicrobia bacterium]|nr:hypothetical protein [Verrucomicrobiota bacterium]